LIKPSESQTSVLEVVITARPSWARVKNLVEEYRKLNGPQSIRLSLVGPALSHRYGDLTQQLPSWLEYHSFLSLHESDNLDAIAISALEGANALIRHWSKNRPSAVLIIADRTETLGVAVAASLMQIPLIHLQGGEISGSIDDKVRNANSKLADLHITTNAETATNLISMGESETKIVIAGCPSIDLILQATNTPNSKIVNSNEIIGVGENFSLLDSFGVIMFHPDTANYQENIAWIENLIEMAHASKMKWFWFWPNPDHGTSAISKMIRHARETSLLTNVKFVINVEPDVFINVMKKAKVLIGNSSFGIREASYLGLPVLNLGKRQAGRQKSKNVIDVLDPEMANLLKAVEQMVGKKFEKSTIYGDGRAGYIAALAISNWSPTTKLK
jgi:UDP-hydrolysing UDP-N-acetyl-D-glucosamine 2-epimerase